jgi:plasmid replication initiation protein
MGLKVRGGIVENKDVARFTALASDISVKDQMDFMSRCWFSLSVKRTEPIEHQYVDARSNRTETVRITGHPEYGIATIHDQDLIIFMISQWVEAKKRGLEPTRRVCFKPYQFFAWINRTTSGSAYLRQREALPRLKTTNIETSYVFDKGQRRNERAQFSWISEWKTTEENGKIHGVEVVLAEWLFDSIQDFNVLTLDKRYFDIEGSIERWLYLYARKATGGASGIWKESFKKLYEKSASQQAYKHYANRLRELIKKNNLPGFNLETRTSKTGGEMLFMERTEKREVILNNSPQQLTLLEKTPLEETWENVLELMRKHLGAAQVKSWLEQLQLVGLENGILVCRAPTKFIAEWVETHFKHKLEAAWQSLGQSIVTLRIETKMKNSA